MPWDPPPDPSRPELPYTAGFQMTIRSHNFDCKPANRATIDESWLRTHPVSEVVLEYPPSETPDPLSPETAVLTIDHPIRTGSYHMAQVVCCRVSFHKREKGSKLLVAKIFDALYYPPQDNPCDIAKLADKYYSAESAAYDRLQRYYKENHHAEYHESWTFTLPTEYNGRTIQRPVRLVLLEHLNGCTVADLDPADVLGDDKEKKFGLELVARVLHIVSKEEHLGVWHNDVAPRNVMIIPKPEASAPANSLQRVVLIDYDISKIEHPPHPGLPPNPMQVHWNSSPAGFGPWVPTSMFSAFYPVEWQKWLERRFKGDEENYAPVTEKLEYFVDDY